MADIAGVFHWTPVSMNDFEIDELMCWRERASVRSGAE